MGNFCVLAVFIFGLVSSLADSETPKKDEIKAMMAGMAGNCEPKPTDDDFEKILSNDPNPPNSTKCATLCLMKETGALTEDTKLDLNTAKQFSAMMYEDENLGAELATSCNSRNDDPDLCARAHAFRMCTLEELKARNKEIPSFEE